LVQPRRDILDASVWRIEDQSAASRSRRIARGSESATLRSSNSGAIGSSRAGAVPWPRKKSAAIGPNSTDKGKPDSKHDLLVVRQGIPLAIAVTAVNAQDSRMLVPMIDAVVPIRTGEVVFPHYLSGPLVARQWLAFLRFHLDPHRAQVERVRESADFPR
jgi:hypothetical protein